MLLNSVKQKLIFDLVEFNVIFNVILFHILLQKPFYIVILDLVHREQMGNDRFS